MPLLCEMGSATATARGRGNTASYARSIYCTLVQAVCCDVLSEVHKGTHEMGYCNGQGGIRTHDTLAGIPVFETGSFSHSDTCPGRMEDKRER